MENRTKLFVVALFTVLTLVFAVSSPSYAYFGAKVGAFLPNDDDLDALDTGYSVEAYYGYEFTPNFALEAGLGYYHAEGDDSLYDPSEGITYEDEVKLSVVPVTLTAKGTYPLAQGFSVFAGAGVGAYFAKAEEELSASAGDAKLSVDDDDSQTAFGFHALAGGEYKFANGMAALAEFKWFTAEPEFELFKDVFNDYPGEIDIGGIALSVGVKF